MIREQNIVSSMCIMLFVAEQMETTPAQHIIARVTLKSDRKSNIMKVDCPTGKSTGIIRKIA
jgi:hypothetical protein